MTDGAPLSGLCVLNPRPAGQARALTEALQAAGAEVMALPLLDISPLPMSPADERLLLALDHYDGVICVSANAARLGLDAIAGCWPQWPWRLPLLAVGAATAEIALARGLSVRTPAQADSEGLLALPELQQVAGQRWLLLRGDEGRELIPETLRARGAGVDILPLYRRVLPDGVAAAWAARARDPDVVLLSSRAIWRHWWQTAGALALTPVLVTVSGRLADEVVAAGATQVLRAGGAAVDDWLAALRRWHCPGAHGIQ